MRVFVYPASMLRQLAFLLAVGLAAPAVLSAEPRSGIVVSAIDPSDANDKEEPERRKLADLYASFMDEADVDRAGLASLKDALAKIHGLNDKAGLPALFADLAKLWVRIPFSLDVSPDEHDAT